LLRRLWIWNLSKSASYYKVTFMAELNVTGPLRKRAGIRRRKYNSLKIEMTPMVDLGFLLIAFFIFTTEISKPAVTKLYMPHDGDITRTPDSKSLTILLGANNLVFYYYGIEDEAIKNKNFPNIL